MKSARLMRSFSAASGSSSTLLPALISRFMAVDCAARTSPSSSAPEKFLESTANSARSTSGAILRWVRI
uniref:Putative secreted protein n=1 Tax=Ixodes ricinus TaxID=34613 RepID=A0A6B0TR61_IXORI